MKILKLRFVALMAVLAAIGSACSVDDAEPYCFSSYFVSPKTVTGASTTTVNTPLVLTVGYQPTRTCAQFNRFVESATFPKDIQLRVDFVGCDCPATNETRTQNYTFTATTPGEYQLKFIAENPENNIVKTITVTAE